MAAAADAEPKMFDGTVTKEELNAREMEQMELLEQRFHTLHELHSKTQANACDTICMCFFEILRSIPWCTIMAIIPTIAGIYMMSITEPSVESAVSDLSFGKMKDAALYISYVKYFYIVIIVIDALAVIAGFGAAGDTREYIFGHKEHGCMLVLQVLAGPITFCIILWLLVMAFASLFALNFATLPATTLVALASSACKIGPDGMQGFVSAIKGMSKDVVEADVKTSLDAYCHDDYASLSAGCALFTLGVALATIGQVCQLMMHANNIEKVMMQDDVEEDADKGDVKEYYEKHNYGKTDM